MVKLPSSLIPILLFSLISIGLESHEEWGLQSLLSLNSLKTPSARLTMRAVSLAGFEAFFVTIPLLAWSGLPSHEAGGLQLAFTLVQGFFIQSALKAAFGRLRPEHVDLIVGDGGSARAGEFYSFPSGHAFGVTLGWLTLADHFDAVGTVVNVAGKPVHVGRTVRWLVAPLLIAVTGFSRLFLGVHYPHDVIAGILLAIITNSLLPQPRVTLHSSVHPWHLSALAGMLTVLALTPRAPGSPVALGGFHLAPAILAGLLASQVAGPRWQAPATLRSLAARCAVGVPPIALLVVAQKAMYVRSLQQGDSSLFGAQFLLAAASTAWMFWFGPALFLALGMATRA